MGQQQISDHQPERQQTCIASSCLHRSCKASPFWHCFCQPLPLSGLFVLLLVQQWRMLLLRLVVHCRVRQSCLHCASLKLLMLH